MNPWIAILAGLGGTLVMTCFTQIMSHILKKPFYVVIILAAMLPFKKDVSTPNVFIYITAAVIHYFIGVIFSYLYLWQLVERLPINDVLSALLYGAIIGSIAVIGWRFFFFIHPNPPPIELIPYLIILWFGHITLSITLAAIFNNTSTAFIMLGQATIFPIEYSEAFFTGSVNLSTQNFFPGPSIKCNKNLFMRRISIMLSAMVIPIATIIKLAQLK